MKITVNGVEVMLHSDRTNVVRMDLDGDTTVAPVVIEVKGGTLQFKAMGTQAALTVLRTDSSIEPAIVLDGNV